MTFDWAVQVDPEPRQRLPQRRDHPLAREEPVEVRGPEEADEVGAAAARSRRSPDRSLELGIDDPRVAGLGRRQRSARALRRALCRSSARTSRVRVEVGRPAELLAGGMRALQRLEVERIEPLGEHRVPSRLDLGAALRVRLVRLHHRRHPVGDRSRRRPRPRARPRARPAAPRVSRVIAPRCPSSAN